MSDSPVPAYVDTRKIFLRQGNIAGFVPLEKLDRFRGLLASKQGSVFVELDFSTDDSGQRIISGHISANVVVICQRCLEPLGIALEDDIRLALLKDETKISSLDVELDPWICPDNKLDLASLVEEQLMLCIPIVSYHEAADCNREMGYATERGKPTASGKNGVMSPFSVLKSLKEDDATN